MAQCPLFFTETTHVIIVRNIENGVTPQLDYPVTFVSHKMANKMAEYIPSKEFQNSENNFRNPSEKILKPKRKRITHLLIGRPAIQPSIPNQKRT